MTEARSGSAVGPVHVLEHAAPLAAQLVSSTNEGVFLSAPRTIERPAGWRLPLVIAQRGSADELDRYALEDRGFVVFLDDESGATRIAPLMAPDAIPRVALRLLGESPDSLRTLPATRVTPLDAARLLTFPRLHTTGSFLVVIADRRSNVERVTLEGVSDHGELGEVTPAAVAETFAERLATRRSDATTPPTGITLRIERYAVRRAGAALLLRCSFRLPRQAARASGVVVTLVATGALSPSPRAVAFTVEPRIDGDDVVGEVAVDLFGTAMCETPDTWFIHAFIEGHAGGPATTTIVRESD